MGLFDFWASETDPRTGRPFASYEDWRQVYGEPETPIGQSPTTPEPNVPPVADPSGKPANIPPIGGDPNRQPDPPAKPAGQDYTSWWNASDPQGSFMGLVNRLGLSPSSGSLLTLGPYLQAVGGRLENPNASGITSKIYLPGINGAIRVGNYFDGGGTPAWGWMGQGSGTGGGPGLGGGLAIDPSMTAPFTEKFDVPDDAKQPGPISFDPFNTPTADSILSDPSYGFRKGQALDALKNERSARGLTNSGGTLFDLGSLASDFASQEYGNVYNRGFNLWNTNQQNKLGAYDRSSAVAQTNYKNAFDRYNTLRDTYYQNQQHAFDRFMEAARLGLGAAAG